MSAVFNFLKEILMLKRDNSKIGLSQFKEQKIQASRNKSVSIRNKEIKLSDLMRRVG